MKEIKQKQNRIKWLDVAKFIGIFWIFLGHFGNIVGNTYKFVFYFHVPLFFFLSGCSESLSKEISTKEYIFKNIKRILLPLLFFAFISLLVNCVGTRSFHELVPSLLVALKGFIRNTFFASGLWFFTCLFVIKISFFLMKKILKKPTLILILSFGLFLIAELLINPRPSVQPHMFFNIDSACYYMIYYSLGYYSFNLIEKMLTYDKNYKKFVSLIGGIVASIYTILLFFEKDLLIPLYNIEVLGLFASILCSIIVIVLIILISKLLENAKLFSNIGENTLYLCGSEYVVKTVVTAGLRIIGFNILLSNPTSIYIYNFILIIICNMLVVPIEKKIFKKLNII